MKNRFVLTRKSFETPLGVSHVDLELADALEGEFPADRLDGEFAHKNEHSIEFQSLFLQYVLPQPEAFSILPILCGSFQDWLDDSQSPEAEIYDFCEALRKVVRDSGRKACFVAGVDLSHMGQKFGDRVALSEGYIAQTRDWDREMLALIESCDREGFLAHWKANGDRQKVCGVPPIYVLLSCVEATRAKLLNYDLNVEEATQSFVSFASMAFYR